KAESIRQVFAYVGVAYDDVRIPQDKWPALKPRTPFGQLPLLEVDGETIAQSVTILRFLGKQFRLGGRTPLEIAKLNMVVDQITDFLEDIKTYMAVVIGMAKGDKDTLFNEVFLPNRDKHFALIEKQISGEFILGHITWADIHLANTLESLACKIPNVYRGFPTLKEYVYRVQSTPGIKAHIAARPDAPF
ncbi:hypothetical protein PMAYCL1PPCAC_21642, partial [Pristionchus mayeri]